MGGLLAQRLMRSIYRTLHRNPEARPLDPGHPSFNWPDAIIWAAAAGVGMWLARVLSDTVAAKGWELATGTEPPGWSPEDHPGVL